jgi:hypothetical protein
MWYFGRAPTKNKDKRDHSCQYHNGVIRHSQKIVVGSHMVVALLDMIEVAKRCTFDNSDITTYPPAHRRRIIRR